MKRTLRLGLGGARARRLLFCVMCALVVTAISTAAAGAAVTARSPVVHASTSLRVTALTQSSISLAWTAPRGARFLLRRTNGTAPVQRRRQGHGVHTKGRSATDTHLKAGSQYSYALFVRVHGRWKPPLTIVASTAPAPGSNAAAYVLAPGTVVPSPGELLAETPSDTGVRVAMKRGTQLPTAGAIVLLPKSASLPDGYIGKVATVSDASRSFALLPAGLGDAFDYYQLGAPDLPTDQTPLQGTAQASRREVAHLAGLSSCLGLGGDLTAQQPSWKFDPGSYFDVQYSRYPLLVVCLGFSWRLHRA